MSRGPALFLTVAGLIIAGAAVLAALPVAQAHGDDRTHALACMLAIGALGLAYWAATRRKPAAPGLGALQIFVFLVPAYAIFQILPLPLEWVRLFDPNRAELADALAIIGAKPSWIPVSVAPALTLYHALLLGACAVLFFVVYDLAWRFDRNPWIITIPLIAVAAAEAALGFVQTAVNPDGIAKGTYGIRNHYAGLLEMTLPFAAAHAVALIRHDGRARSALLASVELGIALMLFSAILLSLSRMGFVAALAALLFVAAAAAAPGRSRRRLWLTAAAVPICAALAFVFLPPARLILRFANIEQQDRPGVWRDTLHLIAAYPAVGCGLGGYESAFTRYKTTNAEFIQDYAHNDYLQYLAELGVAGYAIAAAAIGTLLWRLGRAWRRAGPEGRWLAVACGGSLAAIGLHSVVDFNLYVPANMFVLAWVLGIAAYLGSGGAAVQRGD